MKKVSILVPCYNEERTLPLLYEHLKELMDSHDSYGWELLFVNDGSEDATQLVIDRLREQDQRVNYVALSRNFGKESAMLAGFDYVTGDCTVVMDADLQHPPALVPEMLEWWEKGYEDVYAKRTTREKENWLRKKCSLLFYRLLQKTSKIDILQNVGDFRLLDRCCIDALRKIRESERYTKGMFCWIGFRKKELLFECAERVGGKSSFKFNNLFGLAIDGITSFTTTPLRLSTILGFIVSIVAFIYMIFVFIKVVIHGDPVQGFPTLVILILFLGGVQLISLGIIGEYLGRVFNETKNRPTYIAREYNGEKVK